MLSPLVSHSVKKIFAQKLYIQKERILLAFFLSKLGKIGKNLISLQTMQAPVLTTPAEFGAS